MHGFIAWVAFLGGWLLYAGPIFQASVELGEEDFDRAQIESVASTVPRPKPTSPFWWLFPPAAWWLRRRRSGDYRQAVFAAMAPAEIEKWVRFSQVSAGWLLVGAGALCIAVKETWELTDHYEWPVWVFWLLVVGAFLLCVANTVGRVRRVQMMLDGRKTRK